MARQFAGDAATLDTLVDVTRRILEGADQETLRRVISRSVAVSSGKGGVGKTITACNLAILYARKGLRVGLADLDPLSDAASLLDLSESEQALQSSAEWARQAGAPPGGGSLLGDHVLPVFRNLDILFPLQKLDLAGPALMIELLYRTLLEQIDSRYDLLIFDMPAGMGFEDNLAWLPFMRRLILVTNPEPTAHASAGAYAKEVQRLYPGTRIYLWHNRYARRLREGFHPSDVAGNYNRVVRPEDRLSPGESACLADFAFVPEDPALDLLQGEPSPSIHVLKCMADALDYSHARLLSQAARKLGIPPHIRELVTSYVQHNPDMNEPAQYLDGLGAWLLEAAAAIARTPRRTPHGPLFSAEESDTLGRFLSQARKSGLRREMLHMKNILDQRIELLRESRGPFSARQEPAGGERALDRELGRFLVILNRAARGSGLMRSQGVLLLFYFSLHKLLQSRTLVSVLRMLIPRRENEKGRKVRDRFRQIRMLVEGDAAYRQRYLKAVRTLHGLATRQIAAVARALELKHLVLTEDGTRVDGRPYLRLLGTFLHETLYSGLSVIVGFEYRSAAAAFQDGAERLLASLRDSA